MAYKRLGDLLVSVGLISEDELRKALEVQKERNVRLGKLLVECGALSETQLMKALELQIGVAFIDLSRTLILPEMAQVIPELVAKHYEMVVVKVVGDEVYLAMSDPLNFVALEEVKSITHKRVIPLLATLDAVERTLMTLYGNVDAAQAIEEMKREASAEEGENLGYSTTLGEDSHSAPTIRLVNSMIERAITEQASDIHLEPREDAMVVRIRVDGMMHDAMTVPSNLQGSVISRLKVMGGMNTSERKLPQDGRANVRIKNSDIDLRISTLPTIFGEKMVIRLLDKRTQLLNRQGIGLDGDSLERYSRLICNTSGVILIAGPTGSGKSSTLYTMIRELNADQINLMTLEDPVEYHIDGVNQCQINEKKGMTFASGLRSILRQDPDIIAVGEIRDGETAEIAVRAAITGHLVLSTIHTEDAVATLDRLFDVGVEPYLVASALKGVIAQRLVRRICPQCKKEYEPTEQELELLRMSRQPGLKFYQGEGCPMCFHSGYRGRTGVFEVFMVDHPIRRLIRARASREEVMEAALQRGFVRMETRCKTLVCTGVTSTEEFARTMDSTLD